LKFEYAYRMVVKKTVGRVTRKARRGETYRRMMRNAMTDPSETSAANTHRDARKP